jgi:hypothetical protein
MSVLRWAAASLLATTLSVPPVSAHDGDFGVFFDRNASQCSGTLGTGWTTLYVLLIPNGATQAGIHAAELRVTSLNGDNLILANETYEAGALPIGSALGTGVSVGFAACKTGAPVPILSFQVLANGSVRDCELRVTAKQSASNPNFQCPVAVLCDEAFTSVCASGGKAILNPGSDRPCGSGRASSEWTRVKEFYR